MIRLCSGFPPEWPAAYRDGFLAAYALHWPDSIDLAVDDLSRGGALDRYRLIIPAAAADDMADGDLVAWLDPDIETFSAMPSYVIPQLIKDADLCFIGLAAGGTDPAFWAVRLSPLVRSFLHELASAGLADAAAQDGWARARQAVDLTERDLAPGGAAENWAHGPLGRYTRRLAGPHRR